MTFQIFMGHPEMEALWKELLDKSRRNKLSSDEREFLDKWSKALGYLSQNPKHPGLQTHEIDDLSRKFGMKVWQSYLENNTPGAGRIFWAYGPDRRQITILAVERHPESGKRKAYERVHLSRFPKPAASSENPRDKRRLP
ncbi:MAG TPA: hypothetical protein VGZ93_12610 [Candidatus Methylacidiphilales bacterium]|jgi:hypothetical protein|nr:hypothetical protein [Candidatus Methylacidiphilales bacterium]